MKKRIISLMLTLVLFIGCTPRLNIPSIPNIPNISNSVSIPKLNIKF